MVSVILLAVVVILFLYKTYKYVMYRPENFPPGPPRLPLVGSYLFLLMLERKNLHDLALRMCKYYKSNVIGYYFGGNTKVVTVTSYKLVKEVLQRPEFAGRNDIIVLRLRERNFKLKGMFFIDGDFWRDQRRFTLRHLRDFGFGRRFNDFEAEMREEILDFIQMIKDGPRYKHEEKFMKGNGRLKFPYSTTATMTNCFLQVSMGQRINREDQAKAFKGASGSFGFIRNTDELGNFISIFPWLRHINSRISKYKNLRDASLILYNFVEEIVKREIDTYQDGHTRHFIDVYLNEMKNEEQKLIGFDYDQLVMFCLDMIFPASSTLPIVISFLVRQLTNRPEIVAKCQEEIDFIVGNGRLPGLDDRDCLPYCEATIRESMRMDTFAPSSVPHRVMEDTYLDGFFLPKDTAIYANIQSVHIDQALWKDPENFRPERFLNHHGKINLKKDFSFPFGSGKRLCIAETFSRNTMFLYTTALLQNFNFKPDPVFGMPSLSEDECGTGSVRYPKDFWVQLEPR